MRMTFNTNASNGERIPASSTRYFDRLATQLCFPARIFLLRPGLVTSEIVYSINGSAGAPRALSECPIFEPHLHIRNHLVQFLGRVMRASRFGGRLAIRRFHCVSRAAKLENADAITA